MHGTASEEPGKSIEPGKSEVGGDDEQDKGEAIGKGQVMQVLEGHVTDFVLYLKHNRQLMKSFRQGDDTLLKDYFGIFVKINRGQEWKQGVKGVER